MKIAISGPMGSGKIRYNMTKDTNDSLINIKFNIKCFIDNQES